MTLYEQMVCILIIAVLLASIVSLGSATGRYVERSTQAYVSNLNKINTHG